MSIINFNDAIGNRTRDLPACSAVPQERTNDAEVLINNMIVHVMHGHILPDNFPFLLRATTPSP